ncbi:TATA box-binding protein-like 1 [Daktulosphaira vitifoliae]|uniref:TATA box-binding protein-like 1 n=1 Tax=Daktulosphaira vitifoliae TaxID=58002 RepID=UPI0021AA3EBA|nr:TATA box-binding protein-like 1 [Daktulosphaira vitifoliae]XP_050537329.1 TATA box-binding protein-like 1 [Daktulosphaira vitifoliae]
MTSLVHQKNGTDINNSITSSALNSSSNMIFYKSEFCEQSDNSALPNNTVQNCLTDNPELNISISNVVTNFSVKSHLNLRYLALNGSNIEYRRENGMLTMKLRKPSATATIWSSGKIACTGSTSEFQAKIASRRIARIIQRLGYQGAKFSSYRIVNVLGSCTLPFPIKVIQFSEKYKTIAQYEPELHPGVTFKIKELKATLKIFSTGSITVTAPSVTNVHQAIEQIYPMVLPFRRDKTAEDERVIRKLMTKKRNFSHIDDLSMFKSDNSVNKRSCEGITISKEGVHNSLENNIIKEEFENDL